MVPNPRARIESLLIGSFVVASSLLRWLFASKPSTSDNPTRRRRRLRFELLEDRLAPATFTVLNNHDAGAGSLRAAILAANGTAAADVIAFAPALANQTITLTSGQLAITRPLTITGLGSNKLTIDGNNAGRIFRI